MSGDTGENITEWIREVLGTNLWESQKAIIGAYTSGKRMCINVAHNRGDELRDVNRWFAVWYLATHKIDARFSPAELAVIDEAARTTPFEWEGLAKATEALRPKSVRCIGMDVAGGGKCSTVTVMRHEDGTLYHEGKDYEFKDGVITALPGGRLWGGKHETMSIGYTLQPEKKRPPLHKPQPWNPPVAKRRKR